MASISMSEALRLKEKVARMQASSRKVREKAGEVVTSIVRAAEVSAVAAGLGYLQGRRAADGKEALAIAGVPLELVVGVAGHAGAIMGVGGAEDHFKAMGDAGLASYFSTLGFTAGKTGQSLPDAARSALHLGPAKVKGQSLTADDLANLAAV